MSQTAVAIGKLLQYQNAGTVEFIIDTETTKFYFLEVNTRIQVEHPITEETVGLDIVALQVFVTSGGNLENTGYFKNGASPQVGHAIECRLCAEDPSRDFMPDLGVIRRWTPALEILPRSQTENTRFETGLESGSRVSIYFDSLIAKIVVWAPTRAQAIAKMVKMVSHTVCIGIRTNQSFLQACLLHPKFQDPEYTTNFIPELFETLNQNPHVDNLAEVQQLLSVFPSILQRQHQAQSGLGRNPFSSISKGFKNQKADAANVQADIVQIPSQSNKAVIISWPHQKSASQNPQVVNIIPIPSTPGKIDPLIKGESKPSVQLAREYNQLSSHIRGVQNLSEKFKHRVMLQRLRTTTVRQDSETWLLDDLIVTLDSERYTLYTARVSTSRNPDAGICQKLYAHIPELGIYTEYHLHSLLSYGESLRASTEGVVGLTEKNPTAPMPCKVLNVLKKDGEKVNVGEIAMVIESMKMEMNVLTTAEGVLKQDSRRAMRWMRVLNCSLSARL